MIESCLRAARISGWGVSRSGAALLSLGLCIPGVFHGAGDVVGYDDPERLMSAVAGHASNGDFLSAWMVYQRAYALMRASPAAIETVGTYCRRAGCPFIGKIAWILGKGKPDLALLDEICHEETDSCTRLLADAQLAKAYLDDTAAPPAFSHEAEIHFIRADRGDPRPWTLVDIGHKAQWGLINSGSEMVEFSARSPVLGPADYEAYGGPMAPDPNVGGKRNVLRPAVLRGLTLGAVTEDRVPAGAREEAMGYISVGMNALLRYSQVCFSWSNATLYLGHLGPCKVGEQPFAATLAAKGGEPMLTILESDGARFRVLVDTGAAKTYCGDQLAKDGGFRFGSHPSFQVRCSREDLPARSDIPWDAEIGMDTLREFNAFGWELNPFRMYFVPKGNRDESHTASVGRGAQSVTGRSYSERLLDETVRAASEGDFAEAWGSYTRLFTLMRTSKRARAMREAYCRRPGGCPDIGLVAWILGKAKDDLSFLDGRCDDVRDPTCARWLERVDMLKAYLDEEPESGTHPPHDVEIEFIHADLNDLRPWTIIHVGGKPMWGMFDTGADVALIPMRSSILTEADYQTYGGRREAKEADGFIRERQDAVLHDFTLGLATENHVPSKAWHPAGDSVTVGMSMLLRYRQVCFSWSEATLHLGSLGPCAVGEIPFGAGLSPRGQPFVKVRMDDDKPLKALVDTGAPQTDCQDRFMERVGKGFFQFGKHPDLTARCGNRSPLLQPAEWVDAVIGMDALSNFEAVGWELDPFRMYFVPRKESDESRVREATKEASNDQLSSAEIE